MRHAPDPSFDRARAIANEAMDYLHRHEPFEPHRLPLDEMKYTTMPAVEERLRQSWRPMLDETTVPRTLEQTICAHTA